MGKDEPQQNGKRRPTSASPYAENYRSPMDLCQRHLINHRLMVSKLTRRELEDKYINLCDENFSMKKRYQEQELQIKKLKTRMLRMSSETSKSKSRSDLNSHHSKIDDLEAQRRELHEKLEALRKNQKIGSREKRTSYLRVRPQSAHQAKEGPSTRPTSASNGEDEDRYDEDRDVVSSSSTEDESSTSKGEPSKPAKSCSSCHSLKAEKMASETEFMKMKMNIKFLHKEIQNEKEKNALLARQLEEKLSYEIMKRNAVDNMEVINLTRQVEDMTKQIQRRQEEEKRAMDAELVKQADLEVQVRKEKDKNVELFEECERLKRSIEKLRENMSEVEIERDSLKRQQENFSKIVDENKLLRYQLDELRKQNEELARQIETLKEEEDVTRNAQKELLEKLKDLQQDNDTLSVLLEGLRTENETLVEEKTVLEENLKSLEASPVRDDRPTPRITRDFANQTDHVEPPGVLEDVQSLQSYDRSHDTIEEAKQFLLEDASESPPVSYLDDTRRSSEDDTRQDSPLQQASQTKRVRISQTVDMPKISLLQQNIVPTSPRVSNIALLLSNTYAQSLAKDLRSSRFWATTQRESIFSPASATPEKKRISFQSDYQNGVETLKETKTSDSSSLETSDVQRSYAQYFGMRPSTLRWPAPAFSKGETPPTPLDQEHRISVEISSVGWHAAALADLLAQKVQHFYVEFAFLGERGPLLETPQSADLLAKGMNSKPDTVYHFNHRIEFVLDAHRCQMMREMLKPGGRDMIRFVVVHDQIEILKCSEIGYGSIRLRQEVLEADEIDPKRIEMPIYDVLSPDKEIGTLTILIEGVTLLKNHFCS